MTFVTFSLLAGCLFVAVPIVLHLVMKQQPKRFEFPALQLVRSRHDANRRRLRFRDLLLLALRCACVLLLATALARPKLQPSNAAEGGSGPVEAALVFDTSPRMGYTSEDENRLDVAKKMAKELIDELPRESRLRITDTRQGVPATSLDVNMARDRIELMRLSVDGRPLYAAVDEAVELVKDGDFSRKEVFVFTDLTKAAWPENRLGQLADLLRTEKRIGLYIIDVGDPDARNAGVDQIRLSRESVTANVPVEVTATIQRVGVPRELIAELFLVDGAKEPQNRGRIVVPADGQVTHVVRFPSLRGFEAGTHQGFVRLASDDGLEIDDTAYFTFEVVPPWPVLVGAPNPVDRFAGLFAEAIAPEEFRQKGMNRFDCRTIALDRMEETDLSQFRAVILCDPTPLSTSFWRQLHEYVARGGSLAILLGRNADRQEFNEPVAQEVLPAPLAGQWRSGGRLVHLVTDGQPHPMLDEFRSLETGVPWSSFPIDKYWQFAGEDIPGAVTVLRYTNGDAAFVERIIGSGRVIIATTPLSDHLADDDAWNFIISGWPGFILANSLVDYLAGGQRHRLNYTVGETANIPLPPRTEAAGLLLNLPAGEQFRLGNSGQDNQLSINATDMQGNYRVIGGGAERIDSGFSVNLATGTSNVTRADEEAVLNLKKIKNVAIVRGWEELNQRVSVGRSGWEFAPYLLLLLLVVFCAEFVLSNRFYRVAQTDTARRGEQEASPASSAGNVASKYALANDAS